MMYINYLHTCDNSREQCTIYHLSLLIGVPQCVFANKSLSVSFIINNKLMFSQQMSTFCYLSSSQVKLFIRFIQVLIEFEFQKTSRERQLRRQKCITKYIPLECSKFFCQSTSYRCDILSCFCIVCATMFHAYLGNYFLSLELLFKKAC